MTSGGHYVPVDVHFADLTSKPVPLARVTTPSTLADRQLLADILAHSGDGPASSQPGTGGSAGADPYRGASPVLLGSSRRRLIARAGAVAVLAGLALLSPTFPWLFRHVATFFSTEFRLAVGNTLLIFSGLSQLFMKLIEIPTPPPTPQSFFKPPYPMFSPPGRETFAGRVDWGCAAQAIATTSISPDDGSGGVQPSDDDHDYDLIRIACAFMPAPDTFVLAAAVSATLGAAGRNRMNPQVWSLWPTFAVAPNSRQTSARVEAGMKLRDPEPGHERLRRPGGEVLSGTGEGRQAACWVVTAQSAHGPMDELRLALVVRRQKGEPIVCTMEVSVIFGFPGGRSGQFRAVIPEQDAHLQLTSGHDLDGPPGQ